MTQTDSQLVSVDKLVKEYHRRRVVNEVSMTVGRGEIVGLLGPNGAGKTTTFYMVVGLIRPDSGRVCYRDADITRTPVCKRARMGLGYLSQEPSVFRKLTVEENLLAILELLNLRAAERKERADKLLEELGIAKLRRQRAYTLSGGERRKLEIARALVRGPDVMMLDEPFSGVDPIAVSDIQRILTTLRDRGLGILITDHNVRETLAVVDRAYLMYEGKVLREGEASFLINDEVSRELYLGREFRM